GPPASVVAHGTCGVFTVVVNGMSWRSALAPSACSRERDSPTTAAPAATRTSPRRTRPPARITRAFALGRPASPEPPTRDRDRGRYAGASAGSTPGAED